MPEICQKYLPHLGANPTEKSSSFVQANTLNGQARLRHNQDFTQLHTDYIHAYGYLKKKCMRHVHPHVSEGACTKPSGLEPYQVLYRKVPRLASCPRHRVHEDSIFSYKTRIVVAHEPLSLCRTHTRQRS